MMEKWLSTEEFAKHAHVQPNTLRVHHSKHGHYFEVTPKKRLNGRLLWPLHEWREKMKRGKGDAKK